MRVVFCTRLWHQTGREVKKKSHSNARSENNATPPAKLNPSDDGTAFNLTLVRGRARWHLIVVYRLKTTAHFKSSHGFGFNAETVFVVASHCSGEGE